MHCSKCIRDKLFERYYKGVIWTSGITVKTTSKLRQFYELPPKHNHDANH